MALIWMTLSDLWPTFQGHYNIHRPITCSIVSLEYSLSSVARMSHFCRQWRLKPSASKTICSAFHLHNTSATRELSVYLDGQRLWHECHSTYLVVTLDRTLSYRLHLTKTAGKLKNRNNLLMKLAGSTWGASANTLRSSAMALCYSAAEYCAQVWSRCAYTSQVDVQLNSTMPLISGTLCSTPLPWLPVPSCHWQAGGENRQTWQLANPAWYPYHHHHHCRFCVHLQRWPADITMLKVSGSVKNFSE